MLKINSPAYVCVCIPYLSCLSHSPRSCVVQVVKYMKEKAAEAEWQRQRALEKAQDEREGEGWNG